MNSVRVVALLTVVGLTSCYLDELTAPPADESSIEFGVSGDSIVLLGDSLQLSAAFDGGAGTGATRIAWISRDTTVARVDDVSGVVYGVGAGVTEIEAYLVAPDLDNDLLRTLPMEVQYAGIGMVNDSLTDLGETRQLEARGLDVQGGMHEVVPAVFWTTDDSIISLDSSGVVVALRNGLANVTTSWDTFSAQTPILVRQVAGRIVFGVSSLRFPVLQVDTTVSIQVRDTEDSIITSPQVTWVSSNSTIISVSPTGVLRGLQRGNSLITVVSDTATATLAADVVQAVATLSVNDGNNQIGTVDTEVAVAPSGSGKRCYG